MAVFSAHTFYQSIIKTLPKGLFSSDYNSENIHKKLASLSAVHVIKIIVLYFLSAVLLFSGIAKIIDPLPLLNTLKLVAFLPEELQILIATILPVLEIGLAVLMLLKIKPKITLPIVTVLFFTFLVFSIFGTLAGYGADCGCFGGVVKSGFGLGMILRNTVFFTLSLFLTRNAWPSKLNNK